MKKVSLLLLCIVTLTLNISGLQQHTVAINVDNLLPDKFFMPIVFNRTGLNQFLTMVFNDRRYSQDVLPFSFAHFFQFLAEGKKNNSDPFFFESSIRLFCNGLKKSRYTSPYNVAEMLFYLPEFFQAQYLLCPEEMRIQNAKIVVKDICYSFFTEKFESFKNDPHSFLDELSCSISAAFYQNVNLNQTSKEQLRQTLIRFIDIALMKLIWSPIDQEYCWESVKIISARLVNLMDAHIINQDEFDDTLKTLIESFCRFLDLSGSELSLETITTIKNDISQNNLPLFTLPEQEEYLETKAARLQTILLETEAKIHARMQGIVTDTLICQEA